MTAHNQKPPTPRTLEAHCANRYRCWGSVKRDSTVATRRVLDSMSGEIDRIKRETA